MKGKQGFADQVRDRGSALGGRVPQPDGQVRREGDAELTAVVEFCFHSGDTVGQSSIEVKRENEKNVRFIFWHEKGGWDRILLS
jgi:hypothetical protein